MATSREIIVDDDGAVVEIIVVNNGDGTGSKTINKGSSSTTVELTGLTLFTPYLNASSYVDVLASAEAAKVSAYNAVINSGPYTPLLESQAMDAGDQAYLDYMSEFLT